MTKYISQSNGNLTEVLAGTTGGATDANKIPALDSNGQFALTMMPTGIAPDTQSIATSESLSANDWVNIWNNGGTPSVRRAVNTGVATRAHGFVKASFTHPATAIVYFEGNNTATGLTSGDVYLGATAGQATNTPPTAAGSIVQGLGVATSATNINSEIDSPIILA
jgi:hypothetical protein